MKHGNPGRVASEKLFKWGADSKRRFRETVKFIDEIGSTMADCGEDNLFKQKLEDVFSGKIFSIDLDFDVDQIDGKFNTIFCFEVLEHLYNPLFFLRQIYRALYDEGILYLSSPCRMKILWGRHHFNEIDDKRMGWLFDQADFRVEKMKRIPLKLEWWRQFTGVRPLLRVFFNRTRIYKLKKLL